MFVPRGLAPPPMVIGNNATSKALPRWLPSLGPRVRRMISHGEFSRKDVDEETLS